MRIHVERVIGNVRKKYSILKDTLPIQFLNTDVDGCALVDRIAQVACALCNTVEPLYNSHHGEWHFGSYREVAFREGSCFFGRLHALVTYPYIQLSLRM